MPLTTGLRVRARTGGCSSAITATATPRPARRSSSASCRWRASSRAATSAAASRSTTSIQVASLGLLKAIDRFEPDRPTAFSSFAVPTILGELKRHFRDKGWSVRVPRDLQEMAVRVERVTEELARALGRAPTPAEIAARTSAPRTEQVLEAREAAGAYRAVSLDRPRDDDEDGDGMADTMGIEDPGFGLAEDAATVERLMAVLSDREREVLRLRFAEDLTQSEIGARVGVSQMHVSRLIRQAVARLRDDGRGGTATTRDHDAPRRGTIAAMEHWDLRTLDVEPHQPRILHSARGEARSIAIHAARGRGAPGARGPRARVSRRRRRRGRGARRGESVTGGAGIRRRVRSARTPRGARDEGRAAAARTGTMAGRRPSGGTRLRGGGQRMAEIQFKEITKRYPDGFEAVKAIDLDIGDGEFMILVGPSGCGKSTALRMIAGLEDITEGDLMIGGERVNDLAPRDRDIAMVFQNYALYPHMTVRDNMGFALKLAKADKGEIDTQGRPRRRGSSTSSSTSSASRPTCPAASASAWRWAARSCATRRRS